MALAVTPGRVTRPGEVRRVIVFPFSLNLNLDLSPFSLNLSFNLDLSP